MSTIRRQTIISSAVIYFGFALGLFNTYLFTRQGGFTPEQYGLTAMFIAIANIMFSVAALGMPAYITKFFPYYNDRLPVEKNDLITWALLFPCIGFLPVLVAGFFFKNILIDKIFNNSPELIRYYYWTFPFGFGLTFFLVLEAYLWQNRKPVFSNFLKEVAFRAVTTILVLLTMVGLIKSFDGFVAFYSFTYILLVAIIIVYLIRIKKLHFIFSASLVTKKFRKKIVAMVSFVWAGGLVFNIASVFDTIVIAAVLPNGIAMAGVFTFGQTASSLIQAPQRGVISASVGPLSQAWKEKNLDRINLIYKRSSINQLLFSCAMFCLIFLNFDDGIKTFHLKETYLGAKDVFLFMGLTKIIDMGTGVNSQIIGTSTHWRFEFITGLLLLVVMLFSNYSLTRHFGVVGPAISNLISFTIYNVIRCVFLWKKYRMQPFTANSVVTIVLAGASFLAAHSLFQKETGFVAMTLKSLLFASFFLAGAVILKLSPDIAPVWKTVQKRLGLRS